jgi:activator of HSP90 ATPase
MPTDSIELSRFLPATPDRIYLAWLNGPDHTAMTGGKASVASTEVGGAFSAWDGYIDGVHVALEPGRRIVQAWRSDDFPADAPESHLEVLLEPAPGGARITIRHTELPEGQGPAVLEGWDEWYLAPMERFFAREARRRSAGPKRAAGPARRPARKPAPAKARPSRSTARRSAAKARAKAAPRRTGRTPKR